MTKIHSTKSESIKGKLRLEYTLNDSGVKCRAREDRRIWLEKVGCKAEKSAEKGRTRELYKQPGKSQTRSIDKLQQSRTREG